MKTSKRVCNKCGAEAKIFSDNKWWCCVENGFGTCNLKGYCKEEKKNESDEKQ